MTYFFHSIGDSDDDNDNDYDYDSKNCDNFLAFSLFFSQF